MIGALVGYFVNDYIQGFSKFILPLTVGGFIYIAPSDLIPELHKENDLKRSMAAFSVFLLGVVFIVLAKKFLPG